MMSLPHAFPMPGAFAAACARWLSAAFAVLGLLWLLGFEAVLYHATPLHARPASVLTDARILAAAAVLMAGAAMLLQATVIPRGEGFPRRWALAWGLAASIVLVAWTWEPRAALEALRFHVLAIAAFTAGAGLLLSAAAEMGLPSRTPGAPQRRLLLLGAVVFCFVLSGSMAMIRGGAEAIPSAFAASTFTWLGDVDKVGTPYVLFRDFHAMRPALSDAARSHPPGALLLVWAVAGLTGAAPLALGIALMAFASLAVIPLYAWVAAMATPRAALFAAFLYGVIPGVTLFSANSIEAALAPITLLALAAFARALQRSSWPWALAAGGLFAAATLLHFALLSMGFWFLLAGILHAVHNQGSRTAVRALLWLLMGFTLVHGMLFGITGFDYAATLLLAWESLHAAAGTAPRAAWHWWLLLNPLALFFYAGVPVCLLALRASQSAQARAVARCSLLAFACLAVTSFGMGGSEQTAFHAYPFAVLPAALLLEEAARRHGDLALTAVAMGLSALQAWIVQSYFQV